MAEPEDVLNVLASLAKTAFFPNGAPTTAPSPITEVKMRFIPGWPAKKQLDADMAAGNGVMSFWVLPGIENVTRYPLDWLPNTAPVKTVSATVLANTVTIAVSGSPPNPPQNIGLLVTWGPSWDNGGTYDTEEPWDFAVSPQFYAYAIQRNDTAASIAAALAAIVPGATATGNVLTIPSAAIISARVGGQGTSIQETGRVRQRFQTTIWANTPELRAAIGKVWRPTIMSLTNAFITMPDGFAARMILRGDVFTDKTQKQNAYRRDLIVAIEYATTQTETETEIIGVAVDISGGVDPTSPEIGIYNF